MKRGHEILVEIVFYILEKAKCEEDTYEYIEHVLDFCKKNYHEAYMKQNGIELTINKVHKKFESQRKNN